MFGIDVFNNGHTYATLNKGSEGGTVSFYAGTKIKIYSGCNLDSGGYKLQSSIDNGTAPQPLIVEMTTQTLALYPADLPNGDSSMTMMYIPKGYKVTITTTNGSLTIEGPQNIDCFNDAISESENNLGLSYDDKIESIKIEDKNFVGCANQNRIENDDGSCGGCGVGYFENENYECVTCASVNQIQVDDFTCGNCIEGYVLDETEDSPTLDECIPEAPEDDTLLYVGGGLLGVSIVLAILMSKK